jgi:hypothetical protein
MDISFDDLIPGAPKKPVAPKDISFDDLVPAQNQKAANVRDVFAAAMPFMGGSLAPDVAMGAKQTLDAAAQMAARGLTGITSPDSGIGKWARAQQQSTEDANAATLAAYQKYDPQNTLGSSIARGVGQMAALSPVTPAMAATTLPRMMAQGAGMGAAYNALTPVYNPGNDFLQQKAEQAKQGAIGGGLTAGALGAAGRVLSPDTSAQVKTLMDAGVTPTMGQTLGGITKSIEDKLTSVPLLGDMIKGGQRRTIDEFNRAVYARTLAPLGEEGLAVANSAPIGREGITKVGDYLSQKYNQALDASAPSQVDGGFRDSTTQLLGMVPQALRQDFISTLTNTVGSKVTSGVLTPQAAKAAESELGQAITNYKSSSSASERVLGQALQQAQANLRAMIARSNPETSPLIQSINQGWANLTQLEKAGSMLGAKEGVISPANYMNAIKSSDKSVRDRAFARGEARNQDLGQAAASVLPNSYPDSGSIGRLLAAYTLGGGAAVMGASHPYALGAGALATLPYTPLGQKAMAALLAKRPVPIEMLGNTAKSVAPYLGALGLPGLLGASQ